MFKLDKIKKYTRGASQNYAPYVPPPEISGEEEDELLDQAYEQMKECISDIWECSHDTWMEEYD